MAGKAIKEELHKVSVLVLGMNVTVVLALGKNLATSLHAVNNKGNKGVLEIKGMNKKVGGCLIGANPVMKC